MRRLLARGAIALVAAALLAGCGGSGSTATVPSPSTSRASTGSAASRTQGSGCSAQMNFPLCPLPLPGFPGMEERLGSGYRNYHGLIKPEPSFGVSTVSGSTEAETHMWVPDHSLTIDYGMERPSWPYGVSNGCEDVTNSTRATVRGDERGLMCVLDYHSYSVDIVLWNEMGTVWEAGLSTYNGTRPYPISEFIEIIDKWTPTGDPPLPQFK